MKAWMGWRACVAALAVVLLASCGGSDEPVVRKSVTMMTAAERQDFVTALHRMKATPSQFDPRLNAYDYFVELHVRAFADHTGAHMSPGFLPWHRELLRRFELELRRVSNNPSLYLPYWDWIDPATPGILFSNDFMGGDGDAANQHFVTSGPFRLGQWSMADAYDATDDEFDGELDATLSLKPAGLQRKFDTSGRPLFPVAGDVASLLNGVRAYDVAPYDRGADSSRSMRGYLEGWWPGRSAMHNGVHVWVGGQMQTASSPNDPLFFLHHANVDRLWYLWQQRWGDETYPVDGHHNRQEKLFQFGGVTAEQTFNLQAHSGIVYR